MDFVTLTIGLAAGAAVGFIGQYLINKFGLKAKRQRIIDDAHKEAEVIKKNKLLEVISGSIGQILHLLLRSACGFSYSRHSF